MDFVPVQLVQSLLPLLAVAIVLVPAAVLVVLLAAQSAAECRLVPVRVMPSAMPMARVCASVRHPAGLLAATPMRAGPCRFPVGGPSTILGAQTQLLRHVRFTRS